MKTVYTEEMVFNDERRIKLLFSFDREIINKIRRLPDCRWNQNLLCWHIHFIENHLAYLNKMFSGSIEFRPQNSQLRTVQVPDYYDSNNQAKIASNADSIVDVEVHPDHNYFLVSFNKPFKSLWIEKLIKLFEPSWDADHRTWTITNIELNLPSFKRAYMNDDCVLNITEKREQRGLPFSEEDRSAAMMKFTKQLYYLNYSARTIRSYEHHLINFLNAFAGQDIQNLTVEQIKEFIGRKTIEPHFSRSYQNQLISAIKLFYVYIFDRKYDLEMIERPHAARKLPRSYPRMKFAG